MHKILISNIGFGNAYTEALDLLKKNAQVIENLNKIRFSEEDFFNHYIDDVDILIAGTEKITKNVINKASKLKLIGRVGSGIDNIDLESVKTRNINICYTPDAPSMAVPEFTIGLILNLIKGISLSDRKMHNAIWYRSTGRSLSGCKFGVVGAGKIGANVIKLMISIEPLIEVYFYDPNIEFIDNAKKTSLDMIFQTCDIVSLHIPLNQETYKLVDKKLLNKMKKNSYLINTSRGGVVDEESLYDALKTNLAGAALDVFEQEPYSGNLCKLENCILTSHIGSMNREIRVLMEKQIIEDVMNFMINKPLIRKFDLKDDAHRNQLFLDA